MKKPTMKNATSTNKISILDDDTIILQTNPADTKAVGIVYNDNELLPQISHSEVGLSAQILMDNAFKLGIKVKQDADLTEVLSALEIGQYIPPQAFEAVAEIIFYLYRASGVKAPLLDFNQIINGDLKAELKGYKTSMKEKNCHKDDNDTDTDLLSVTDHQARNKFIDQ